MDIYYNCHSFYDLAIRLDIGSIPEIRTLKEIEFIKSFLSKKDEVLDIMCGVGRHASVLHDQGYNITGIDAIDIGNYNKNVNFKYIKNNYYIWCKSENNLFEKSYCIYSNFRNANNFILFLKCTSLIMHKKGILILETTNSEYMKTKGTNSYKLIKMNDKEKIERLRLYNPSNAKEETIYIIQAGRKVKKFKYTQKLFSQEDILGICHNLNINIIKIGTSDELGITPGNPERILCVLQF